MISNKELSVAIFLLRSKYKPGTVVLYFINLHHAVVNIDLNPSVKNVVIDQYLLSPEGKEITSK